MLENEISHNDQERSCRYLSRAGARPTPRLQGNEQAIADIEAETAALAAEIETVNATLEKIQADSLPR